MSTQPASHAYIGIAPCGCVRFISADLPEMRTTNAKEIARLIRDGYTVEWHDAETAKARFCQGFDCRHRDTPVAEPELPLGEP